MASLLEQLQTMSTIVADTGDIQAIRQHRPQDATTNPSLLLKAASLPEYASLIQDAVDWARGQSNDAVQQVHDASDKLAVNAGVEILQYIPGRVSTEVDARLSFDTQATVRKAHKLMELYQSAGIARDRVLIKIASTWEGIAAAELLERDGIACNLTLMFNFAQARACAEAGVTLISPFVGRILDWHKAKTGQDFSAEDDPGVKSVREIYAYYKNHGYTTTVMGASFRTHEEVLALAGCDCLTISPALLDKLDSQQGIVTRQLSPPAQIQPASPRLSQTDFRWQMNEDAMATEKLAEGIRGFAADQIKLEQVVAQRCVN